MSVPRRYERIEIELPCRLFIPGESGLRFEAFCTSQNLGLGGLFVTSSFLLRAGLELYVELALPDGPLAIRSRISHVVPHGDRVHPHGHGDRVPRRRRARPRDAAPVLHAGALRELLRRVRRGVPAPSTRSRCATCRSS